MSFINDYYLNLLILILTIVVNNCFLILILPVSRSISRKISAQYTLDDEIDFDDLNVDDDSETQASSTQSSDTVDVMQRTSSSITNTSNGVSRRESRGVSQVGIMTLGGMWEGSHGRYTANLPFRR